MNIPTWAKSVVGIVTVTMAVFFFWEERYAQKLEVERVKAVILKKDLQSQKNVEEVWLDINAKARDYWIRKQKKGEPLSEVDLERLDFLNEQVPIRQARVEELQDEIVDLEKEIELE